MTIDRWTLIELRKARTPTILGIMWVVAANVLKVCGLAPLRAKCRSIRILHFKVC